MKFIYRLLITSILCLLFALLRANNNDNNNNNNELINSSTSTITSEKEYSLNGGCFANKCSDLKPECFKCKFNYSCIYGQQLNATCMVSNNSKCQDSNKEFIKTYHCAFCYQLPPKYYDCTQQPCQLYSRIKTMCTVHDDILCLGHRKFYKFIRCQYQSGYKWSTALLLSVTLGGFGVDRFYLGNWQEGIGKLFSFGGLGIWTLIDVVLIATGYLKPNDGSVYI